MRSRNGLIGLAIGSALICLLAVRPQLVLEIMRNLAALSNILLFVFAFGALAWFLYWVILRRMLRARRIANARVKRMMQENSKNDGR